MKSKILAGLCTLGLSLTALATGCGDSDSDAPGGGGGGDTTTTGSPVTGSTIQSGTVTATVSSTGSMMGDGNDTFADADPLEESNGIPGISDSDAELNPPDSDVDYYTFNGLAGLASIQATSKPDGDPFASTDPDIVLSLYDSQQNLLAVNDDPYPRNSQDSTILTILPEDGSYFLKVEEFCNTPGSGCDAAYYMGLRDYSYAIDIYMEAADVLANPKGEAEPNDTSAMATNGDPLVAGMPGSYYLTLGYGEFGSMTDVDFFSFTMPNDITVDAGTELEAFFTFQPPGAEAAEGRGSGSSRFSGSVQVLDSTSAVIGVQDYSLESSAVDYPDLSLPLIPGQTYFVRVTGGANDATGPLAPFYIYANGFSQSNQLETAEVSNSIQATPEVLAHPDGNTTGYFVSGHLPAADLDHFSIASEGNTGLTVVCAGGRIGSGVEDLEAEIIAGSDGMVLGSGTETGDAEILIGGDGMPVDVTGESTIIIRITGTPNPLVVSNHYRCGFNFSML